MTFIEAAIEVLRREGRPLHYEKITELAIKYRILSHVGKNPESTMSTRLSIQARGNRSQSQLVRLKPGIFALHEWKGNPPGPRKLLPHEVYEEAPEEIEVQEVSAEPEPRQEVREARKEREPRRDGREPREAREVRDNKESREPREARDNKREEPRRETRDNKESRDNKREEPRRETRKDLRTKRRSLVEIAEETLRASSDSRPKTLKQLVQAMPEHQVDTSVVAAALTVDNTRRRAMGLVPTFNLGENSVALTELSPRKKTIELEQEISRISQERNLEFFKEIAAKISSLRGGVLEHWVTLALENAGFGGVRLMRRSSLGNFIIVARATQNLSNAKIVAMVRCQGASITAKDVSDLRANLETYRAQSAIVISFTGITESALTEAVKQSPTVILWDENLLAKLVATQTTVNHRVLEALS
jgi:ribonuclease E